MSKFKYFVIFALLITGCASQNTQSLTPVAQIIESKTLAVTSNLVTSTHLPSSTPSFTPSKVASPTPSATQTQTATPSSTNTSTLTQTTRPTVIATTLPAPTATSQPAPVFAQTPMLAFNPDTLIQYLGLIRDSFRSAYRGYAGIDNPGGCSTYNGWLNLWIVQAPGFTDVPSAWNSVYSEYRSWLQQAVSATWEHNLRCGGSVTDSLTSEQVAAMADFFNRAYPRLDVLLAEAQLLPR